MLVAGSLIYARVALAHKDLDTELECVHPATGKADGLGELKGGMLFDLSLGFARRLMMPHPAEQGAVVVLEELAKKIAFEVAVGRNGKIWIDAGDVSRTLVVGRAVTETDQMLLSIEEQRRYVNSLLKNL